MFLKLFLYFCTAKRHNYSKNGTNKRLFLTFEHIPLGMANDYITTWHAPIPYYKTTCSTA